MTSRTPDAVDLEDHPTLNVDVRIDGDDVVVSDTDGFEKRVPPKPDWWSQSSVEWVLASLESDEHFLPEWAKTELRAKLATIISDADGAPTKSLLSIVYGTSDGSPLGRVLYLVENHLLRLAVADALLVAVAAAVSVELRDGEPFWLLLVGAASGSKSETIRILSRTADRQLSDITLAGLLSGRPPKEGSPVRRTGLLAQLGDDCHAFVTISDLSSLLSRNSSTGGGMSGRTQTGVFEALRDIYDGAYQRDMDRATPEWHGRITFVAACTPAIDDFTGHTDALGPRWCYYRLPALTEQEREAVLDFLDERGDVELIRAEVANGVQQAVIEARGRVGSVELDDATKTLINHCANIAAYGRAIVPRDHAGLITAVPYWEEPARLKLALTKLARSLVAMELNADVMHRIVRHSALSCLSRERATVLETLRDGEWHGTSAVAKAAGQRHRVALRALEDLEAVRRVVESRQVSRDGSVPTDDEDSKYRILEWRLMPRNTVQVANLLGQLPLVDDEGTD